VEVWLITGFLGSGKTTLLRELTAHSEPGELAVIINEFADLGIDQAFVRETDHHLTLIEGGCVCCSVRDDLVEALRRLRAYRESGVCPSFRRLVIETTGLADPNPVIHALLSDRGIASGFTLAAVITLVDAARSLGQLDAFQEAASQIAAADCLLISKADEANPAVISALQSRLSQLNPVARQHFVDSGRIRSVDASDIDPLDFCRGHRAVAVVPSAVTAHSPGVQAHVITLDFPPHWQEFSDWLQALCLARGRDLLRVKGILFVAGEAKPRAINAVNFCIYPSETIEAAECGAERVSCLVFIGRNLDVAVLRRTLDAALGAATGRSPADPAALRGCGR
jgi:G3E family GTPase